MSFKNLSRGSLLKNSCLHLYLISNQQPKGLRSEQDRGPYLRQIPRPLLVRWPRQELRRSRQRDIDQLRDK